MMLSAAVTVVRRFQRSVRIDADLGVPGALHGFVCQGSSKAALETMARLIVETGQGAFTWTGPYGGGKSSLALALCAYVAADLKLRKTMRDALKDVPLLEKVFPVSRDGWLTVPIVGRRSEPVEDIREAVAKAVASTPGKTNTRRGKPEGSGRDIIDRLVREAEARPRGGVLLVIDELGKFLEGAAEDGGDIHFFQELAEAASRSNGRLVVLGILHQAFEQYASRLGREARDEWAKVQGRFVDIPIVTAVDEVIDLISQAVESETRPAETMAVAQCVADAIRRRRPGSPEDLAERLDAGWPLHPVTVALLGPVSRRRFGQNERSVFGFLGSSEPGGFQEYLNATQAAGPKAYEPSQLWDYLRINLEPAILASPDGHRWAQGAEAVERSETRGKPVHVRLAKSIALIDLFRNGSGLAAESNVLRACLSDVPAAEVEAALRDLEQWSVVIFRKHLGAWGVYAGSDFDIGEAINAARPSRTDLNLARLARIADMQPLLAKQHYHRTGTLRWFQTELIAVGDARDAIRSFVPQNGASGQFLLAIPEGDESRASATKACRAASKLAQTYPVALGLPRNGWLIRELGAELVALETIRSTRPELEGDSVARREVAARIAATRAELEEELRAAFREATWFVGGKAQNTDDARSLARLVSTLADNAYPQVPLIHSELVNRERPSSNSQAAVRLLLYAMINKPNEERLGIEGFSAERGLYSTVLEVSGLHGRGDDGAVGFNAPSSARETGASMVPMWRAAEELLEGDAHPTALAAIYETWMAPPFGVRRGLLPILGMAFIQAHRSSVAVYFDDTFQPDFSEVLADRLLQDPRRIKLRPVNLQGQSECLLQEIADALREIGAAKPEPEPLAVARGLVGFAFRLPAWTRKTLSLSREATAVRRILLNASDPHQSLFVDLPLVFEGTPATEVGAKIADVLWELNSAYPRMLDELHERMMAALGHEKGDFKGLQRRASIVQGVSGDLLLDAFAAHLAGFSGMHHDMEAVAGSAISKPARDWSDRDPDRAALALAQLALKFRHVETLVSVKGRTPTQHALAVVFGTGETGRTVMESFAVSEIEKSDVLGLANTLASILEKTGARKSVALAALAEVGARIMERDHDGEDDSASEAAA